METREEVQHGIESLAAEALITQRIKDELAQVDEAIVASSIGQHRAQLQELLRASQQTARELRETVDRSALAIYQAEGNKKPHSAVSIRMYRKVVYRETDAEPKLSDADLRRWALSGAQHWLKLDRRMADKDITARFKVAFDGLDTEQVNAKIASMSPADQALWAMVTLEDDPRVTVAKDLSEYVVWEEATVESVLKDAPDALEISLGKKDPNAILFRRRSGDDPLF